MADFTLLALKNEIVNDSNSVGYKTSPTVWKADQAIVDLISDPTNGAQITRKQVIANEIVASIDLAEYAALTMPQRQYLDLLTQTAADEFIDANEATILNALTTIFGPGTASRASLLAKLQRQGSRAEVLWGEGKNVTAGEVGRAANL